MGFLVRLFGSAKNDKQQFMTLLRPHIELMHRMAWRWTRSEEDAEDLVQDVLIKLINRGEEMAAVEKLRPWLIRIVYHRYVDLYRSKLNSPLLAQDTMDGNADDDDDNDDFFLDREDEHDEIARLHLRDCLQQALDQLEAPHRDVVMLHDAEGYSDQETATILGISIGTVKSRLHRARTKLKIILEQGTNPG